MPRLLLPLPLFFLLLAACGGGDNGDADTTQPVSPPDLTCHVAYRPAVTQPIQQELDIDLPADPDAGITAPQRHLAFDRLTLDATYDAGPFEGPALSIQVFPTGSADPLARTLYQLPRTQPLRDQFLGGHGFTGLVFVQDPTSGAEIQYFCSLAVPD